MIPRVSIYRDPSAHLREAVRAMREQIDALTQTLSPAFWEALSADEAAVLGEDPDDDLDARDLTQVHARTRRRLDALRDRVHRIEELEASWAALSAEAPEVPWPVDGDPPDGASESADAEALRRCVRQGLRDPEADEVSVTAQRGGARARFRHGGARFVYDYWRDDDGASLSVTARMPRGAPTLRVRPEGLADSISRAFRRGAAVFDARFDAFFVVEGEGLGVALLRRPPLRDALLEIAREDVPVLDAGADAARVRWRFEPGPRSLRAAVAALHVVRGVAVRPLR